MNDDHPQRWDAGLSGLLDAERGNVWAPDGAEERAWARLGVGSVPSPSSTRGDRDRAEGAGRASLRTARTARIGVYLLGVLTGVVGTLFVMQASRGNAPGAQPRRAAIMVPSADVDRDVPAPALVASLSTTADANAPSLPKVVGTSPPPRAPTSADRLDAERLLLDEARVALGRGDGAAALRATTLHAQRFPLGFLSEEREAIAIQALLLVGRYDDARQREGAFELKYPHSVLLQAVRASVESIP